MEKPKYIVLSGYDNFLEELSEERKNAATIDLVRTDEDLRRLLDIIDMNGGTYVIFRPGENKDYVPDTFSL